MKSVIQFVIFAHFVMIATCIICSHYEAQAYNRITGADVTTWEAMWVHLRVDGTPK